LPVTVAAAIAPGAAPAARSHRRGRARCPPPRSWRTRRRGRNHSGPVGAGLEGRRAGEHQAHAIRHGVGRKPVRHHWAQQKARPAAAEVHFLDKAFEGDDLDPIDDRRPHPLARQLAERSARRRLQRPSAIPCARRLPRRTRARLAKTAAAAPAYHSDGSRSASRYQTAPVPAATGSQRKSCRSAISSSNVETPTGADRPARARGARKNADGLCPLQRPSPQGLS
jgi:hypothetical protein